MFATAAVVLAMLNTDATENQEMTWAEQRGVYEFPAWFTEARFGIWAHWGAQAQPTSGSGWYARHMYMEDVGRQVFGINAYPHHNKTYGHPSEFGYKDVLPTWKADKLNTDAIVAYVKSLGAKYFVALANHHDHFDNWDSTHHPWNSVNIGPKRDIIQEFSDSAQKYDMKFGVSSHDDRFLTWWLSAFQSDSSGPMKGVPYDGRLTKEDGKGKWWEGYDPADLYGLPPEKRGPDYADKIGHNYYLRHRELVTRYDVDMLWFDGYDFPYDKHGVEVCRDFYNHSLRRDGKIDVVVAGKFNGEPSTVKDIERGGANEILDVPWQGTLTIATWFFKEDQEFRHNARSVIENMIDINSKNGNLLLNIELRGDGSLPDEHRAVLDGVGAWVNLNSEAIYASKPWKVYGDNLDSMVRQLEKKIKEDPDEADLEALDALRAKGNDEHYNERRMTDPAYGPDEVRFTTVGDKLFVFVLNAEAGDILLPAVNTKEGSIQDIRLIGSEENIEWFQSADGLYLTVPEDRPNGYAAVFEVTGLF
jgi:alpha-L-fucosidase